MKPSSKYVCFALALAATGLTATQAFAQSRSPVDAEQPYVEVDVRSPVDAAPPRPFWPSVKSPVDSWPSIKSPVDSWPPGGGYGGYGRCSAAYVHKNYRLTLCTDGQYSVRGGGLHCDGSYAWRSSYGGVRIDLRRSPCGSGTDWSGDTIRCSGWAHNRHDLIRKLSYGSCVYFPTREAAGDGYRPQPVYFR